MSRRYVYADDDYEPLRVLVRLRAPALFLGLFLGGGISFVTSQFELVLEQNVEVAFFMPFIVYIADAIGTQTESIYSRDLRTGSANIMNYLRKESLLGLIFGSTFGVAAGLTAFVWLRHSQLALSVGLATFLAIAFAPLIALLITEILQRLHQDPAVGSGPVATVIQDLASIVIYGLVCSALMP